MIQTNDITRPPREWVEALQGIHAKHPIYRLLTLLEQTSAASGTRLGRRGGRRRS